MFGQIEIGCFYLGKEIEDINYHRTKTPVKLDEDTWFIDNEFPFLHFDRSNILKGYTDKDSEFGPFNTIQNIDGLGIYLSGFGPMIRNLPETIIVPIGKSITIPSGWQIKIS